MDSRDNFEKVVDDGCEECKKKGETFAALVMIALMDHFWRYGHSQDSYEITYTRKRISECSDGKELLEEWDETINVFSCPVSELATYEAYKLWDIAIGADYIDSNYQPTNELNTKVKKAIFARTFAEKLGLPVKGQYKPFEKLWGVTGLSGAYSGHGLDANHEDFTKELEECLKV